VIRPVIASNLAKLPLWEIIRLMDDLSRLGSLFAKSLGPWLSIWAIRFRTDCDYKLSRHAKVLRWVVVFVGYQLALSLPWPVVRLATGLTGLCFLCWPNFAYHAAKVLFAWPTTQGRVVSVMQDGTACMVTYSFHYQNQTFGGTAKVRDGKLSTDDSVSVAYDPLNPDESKLKLG
jgi:hypothetical protein